MSDGQTKGLSFRRCFSLWQSRKREEKSKHPQSPSRTSSPKISDMHTSVIASVPGPGGYPTILWGAIVFSVHLIWTREKHVSLLARAPRHPSLSLSLSLSLSPPLPITPAFPLVLRRKKKNTWQARYEKCSRAFLISRSGRKSSLLEASGTSETWVLISHRGDDVKWINLPRRGRVLTTGSVLSQWDLLRHSPEGSPVA